MLKRFLNFAIFCLPLLAAAQTFGQMPVCRAAALAAIRPMPELKYECTGDNDYDEKNLKTPERLAALRRLERSLDGFNYSNWWSTSILDLNLCEFRKKPGPFNKEERSDFKVGNFTYKYFGNNEYRVISVTDPCYQTGFGGSVIYLLHRKNGKVYSSKLINAFSSRADNPFAVGFAKNGGEQIIEIATTTGGLNPYEFNYYFRIDPKTNLALPKNMFIDDQTKKPTNVISSAMMMGEPEEFGFPKNLVELQVIKNGQLAKSFYVLDFDFEKSGDNHAYSKGLLRWNGKYYR